MPAPNPEADEYAEVAELIDKCEPVTELEEVLMSTIRGLLRERAAVSEYVSELEAGGRPMAGGLQARVALYESVEKMLDDGTQ